MKLKAYRVAFEQDLERALPQISGPFARLYDSMRYSTCAGGKRIRPLLMKLAYEAVGGSSDIAPYMCAIEMIHTYSLVHDDLPAMDNDDFRRGKLTNHKAFDEATAILAGDALLTYAFEIMLEEALQTEDMASVKAAHVLSEASGVRGMVAGQILDIVSEGKVIEKDTLDLIHLYKTGALIAAATKMGAILGHASSLEITAFEMYGKYLGKVFQIIDDILDQTSTLEELGKPINSDEKNQKITYLAYHSIEECYLIAEELTKKALSCLDKVSGDTSLLRQLATDLVHRKN